MQLPKMNVYKGPLNKKIEYLPFKYYWLYRSCTKYVISWNIIHLILRGIFHGISFYAVCRTWEGLECDLKKDGMFRFIFTFLFPRRGKLKSEDEQDLRSDLK